MNQQLQITATARAALASLQDQYQALERLSFKVQPLGIDSSSPPDKSGFDNESAEDKERILALSLIQDVFVLLRLYLDVAERRHVVNSADSSEIPTLRRWQDLAVLYKALLFAIRATQDALYRIFLIIEQKTPGEHASIADALNRPTGLFTNFITKQEPTYSAWFENFRKRRNDAKGGLTLRAREGTDVNGDYQLVFEFSPLTGGQMQCVTFETLANDINNTTTLVRLLIAHGKATKRFEW